MIELIWRNILLQLIKHRVKSRIDCLKTRIFFVDGGSIVTHWSLVTLDFYH